MVGTSTSFDTQLPSTSKIMETGVRSPLTEQQTIHAQIWAATISLEESYYHILGAAVSYPVTSTNRRNVLCLEI